MHRARPVAGGGCKQNSLETATGIHHYQFATPTQPAKTLLPQIRTVRMDFVAIPACTQDADVFAFRQLKQAKRTVSPDRFATRATREVFVNQHVTGRPASDSKCEPRLSRGIIAVRYVQVDDWEETNIRFAYERQQPTLCDGIGRADIQGLAAQRRVQSTQLPHLRVLQRARDIMARDHPRNVRIPKSPSRLVNSGN